MKSISLLHMNVVSHVVSVTSWFYLLWPVDVAWLTHCFLDCFLSYHNQDFIRKQVPITLGNAKIITLGTFDNTYLVSHVASVTLIHHCASFRLHMAIHLFHSYINILVIQVLEFYYFNSTRKCALWWNYTIIIWCVPCSKRYTLLWVHSTESDWA